MSEPISWKRASEILAMKEALEFTVPPEAIDILRRNLYGRWAYRPNPTRVIVEDQPDIDFVVRHFVPERFGKRNVPVGRINSRTSSGNIAIRVVAL